MRGILTAFLGLKVENHGMQEFKTKEGRLEGRRLASTRVFEFMGLQSGGVQGFRSEQDSEV